ncbi:MAG: hypothetical protein COV52_01595 [Gammaproteobacteria bacterium CG11_big_fil_rev_8_21_14_0_20_46_22]|nr:MAG: hypothetical protein COW05_05490 [Gammaproteobacteria bacterium CG12_big_fil_rev_8_21_14_0_65_46_12]PIR11808.1 MAG: hypothetical protein COV52_01595 [Gammaproteobacteria bacterium CG11_big_fil_rev_8_21_14_0_20_46_22]
MSSFIGRPIQGTGIGLRSCHYSHILQHQPDVPWFEALSDNYFHDPVQLNYLKAIREQYPVTLHGVGLSLGSTDPLNQTYLKDLKQLIDIIQPEFVSDHLSWVSVNQQYLHDLLPLPFTQEAVDHLSERIQQVQAYLGQRILIENASTYLAYKDNEMPEWEFINAIAQKADCYVLLDINNIVVTAANQPFSPETFLENIDARRVKQYHLAGYSDEGDYLFDKHDQAIHQGVWQLYETALKQVGILPTLIERDDHIPPFTTLQEEAKQSDRLMQTVEASYV